MEKLRKRQNKILAIALTMSILFVVGIPAIVLGATNQIWIVMVLGIIFTVGGFYGMPLIWISYGSGFSMLRIVELVERDNVYSVAEIAKQVNAKPNEVMEKIRKALEKRYIEGFLIGEDGWLRLNENVRQQRTKVAVKCHNCGATVIVEETQADCPYCGSLVTRKINNSANTK